MNKIFKTSVWIFFSILSVCIISACSDDDKENGGINSLLGTWQMVKYVEIEDGITIETLNSSAEIENIGAYIWLTVEKDMIYLSSSIDGDKEDYEEPYTYVIKGDQIILTDADDDEDPYTWIWTYHFDNGQLVAYSSEDDDEYGLYEEYRYYEKR